MPELTNYPWRLRTRHMLDTAFRFVFPPVCASCRKVGDVFCPECRQGIVCPQPPLCTRCGRSLAGVADSCDHCRRRPLPLSELRVVALHATTLMRPIQEFKYEGMFALAEPLAALMVAAWPTWAARPDLVVPVPLHPERERERGYNQSLLLARPLCTNLTLPYGPAALRRIRHTRPQVGLNQKERLQNVTGAFIADPELVGGRHILLVDDVCTTGATLAAATIALLAAGADTVSAYCLARAVDH